MPTLTTAALPAALRPDPVRDAVRNARPLRLPRTLAALASCQHNETPLRGQACPECVAEADLGR